MFTLKNSFSAEILSFNYVFRSFVFLYDKFDSFVTLFNNISDFFLSFFNDNINFSV